MALFNEDYLEEGEFDDIYDYAKRYDYYEKKRDRSNGKDRLDAINNLKKLDAKKNEILGTANRIYQAGYKPDAMGPAVAKKADYASRSFKAANTREAKKIAAAKAARAAARKGKAKAVKEACEYILSVLDEEYYDEY